MQTYEEFKERIKKQYGGGLKKVQMMMLYNRYKSDFENKKNSEYLYIDGSKLSKDIKPVEK